MTVGEDSGDAPDAEHGITDEDMELIEAFLAKRRVERSAEDLLPKSNR
jgi:hypothetical protein